MRIVQNFSAIELNFNPADKRLPLKFEHLENKKIQAMYLMGAVDSILSYSPLSGNLLSLIDFDNEDYYLNIFDSKNKHIIKNLCIDKHTFFLETNSLKFMEYNINSLIDINTSYIQYVFNNITTSKKFLGLIFYQNGNLQPFNDVVNGSVNFDIKFSEKIESIKLSDIVNNKLINKRIKRIIATPNINTKSSFLDIKTFSGKRIENLPIPLLSVFGQDQIYFDYLDIDWENSYIHQRGGRKYPPVGKPNLFNLSLTFIY